MVEQDLIVDFVDTMRPLVEARESGLELSSLLTFLNVATDPRVTKTTASDAFYSIVSYVVSGHEYPELNDKVHGFFQSVMFTRWLRKYKGISDDINVLANTIIKLVIEDRRAADYTIDDSCKILRSLMNMAAAAYPALGLSFGYIGNCDLHGNQWDNRNWYIFTQMDQDGRKRIGAGSSASFGGVETEALGRLVIHAEKEFLSWCAALEAKRLANAS